MQCSHLGLDLRSPVYQHGTTRFQVDPKTSTPNDDPVTGAKRCQYTSVFIQESGLSNKRFSKGSHVEDGDEQVARRPASVLIHLAVGNDPPEILHLKVSQSATDFTNPLDRMT